MYVLIFVTFIFGGGTLTMQEFSSKEKCEAAAKDTVELLGSVGTAKWKCEPK